ncbi:MAG: hypothetical protein QOF51_1171 [Chloroflexota bacterium]|jgi:hypothetical protein|nr:hypothetical protein [Chloroflexota bacterium]
MQGFEWAEDNFDATGPHEIQNRGLQVYFAPNIPPNTKVVNLANGVVEQFRDGEERPQHGYYADFESLERFCRKYHIPLNEINGIVSTLPVGFDEAGDPLRRGVA